jgi:Kef-type K+ transport system membrane component KefB
MNGTYSIFLQLGLILILTNFARALFIRLKIPYVIALIIIGVLLGPSFFGFVSRNNTFEWIAQVGILILIFEAGITTDVKRIIEESKKASLPAFGGVLVPFIFGFTLSRLFHYDVAASMFIGTIFTATSISISVITLIDVGKLNSIEGRCIVNSAIIDDVLGIILVSFVIGLTVKNTGTATHFYQNELFIATGNIVVFFIVTIAAGLFLIPRIFANTQKLHIENSLLSITLAIIFIYSWFAEHSGLAAITGAYLAGLFIGQTDFSKVLNHELAQVGKSFFIDIFFVSIGLSLNLKGLSIRPFYLVLFVVLALLSKIIGCGLGAKLSRFDNTRALRIGIGMVPRGEVALIIAAMGLKRSLITNDLLSATVIMVIITSLLTPFMIKFSYTTLKKTSFD